MWRLDDNGQWAFAGGQEDWGTAEAMARHCSRFSADDESEWVADAPVSCYNCRYRRWTPTAFICLAGAPPARPA